MYDVALAMQNLTLAAHTLGLGTVHVGSFDAQKAAQILSVPQGRGCNCDDAFRLPCEGNRSTT